MNAKENRKKEQQRGDINKIYNRKTRDYYQI